MKTEVGRTPEGQRFGIVAYLDLMGSRDLFSSVDSNELKSVLHFAGKYKNSTSKTLGMPPLPFEIPREFVAFQDSLVRCTEIGWTPDLENLPNEERGPLLGRWVLTIVDEIASLRDIQLNFVCKRGLLLRGAMALGAYDVTAGRVHGPAFMNALDGEAKWARYPRVLVDTKIIGFSQTMNPRHRWVQANTCVDADDYWFIDYLYGAACEAPWDASWFVEYAVDHKHLVEAMLRGDRQVPAEKMEWLRGYHDRSIRRTANYVSNRGHMDADDLLIAKERGNTQEARCGETTS